MAFKKGDKVRLKEIVYGDGRPETVIEVMNSYTELIKTDRRDSFVNSSKYELVKEDQS